MRVFFLALMLSTPLSYAFDVTGLQNYKGNISSIAVGFFGHVGVSLSNGNTCNGLNVVVLKNEENALFKEKISLLYSAIATQSEIELYQPAHELSDFSTDKYCLIDEVSYANFPLWH